ncbi:ATP-dependent sacrificial sulfur transferase LarE [Clostridium formicaceticum]|uniref:GMP synthase subunit B n=1 Tax=Clostridium formicaceticum TaxID=1497 RepID=A0AAC9WFN8_9CLOT|nr:ATP-dependent sacrificial sulfur transferase LarE [Clostridium formicaceticum]AOY76594.1 TIGR00268 family protein [Clostridium formicaceticum]ARE87013.1 GMP synthase subunit B [Clostridium formicaceticum]
MEIQEKFHKLQEIIRGLESAAIAFSGGVDSTFLLKVTQNVLGKDVIAVTARSSTFPEREFKEAKAYAESIGVKHIVIVSEELDIEGFSKNPTNRCYYCKHELFSKIQEVALDHNVKVVLDGSNYDDIGDYRPGMQAAKELKVVSPLKQAALTKEDIRILSKEMDIPTWNKPSFACLSSRFPYGHEINREKLKMVELAEQFLLDKGFRQVRVRHHGEIARIEVEKKEREKIFDLQLMDEIGNKLKEIGFHYVTIDALGYRTGSMNEVLTEGDKV